MNGKQAYIGLGSNKGNRESHLQLAVSALQADPQINDVSVSPVYESEAHVKTPGKQQPAYLNAAACFQTKLSPYELLAFLQRLEQAAGRPLERSQEWQARTLDLDLLVYSGHCLKSKELTVPHPRMAQRRFVLQPLVDLNPLCWVPLPFEATAAELLAQCRDPHALRKTDVRLKVTG